MKVIIHFHQAFVQIMLTEKSLYIESIVAKTMHRWIVFSFVCSKKTAHIQRTIKKSMGVKD